MGTPSSVEKTIPHGPKRIKHKDVSVPIVAETIKENQKGIIAHMSGIPHHVTRIDLVWFGIVTVIGAEIGLLTPPLGISCFTIKSTIQDRSISLSHIFTGAAPFAFMMLLVLILIVAIPQLSLVLVPT